MDVRLESRTALITGGSLGLGRAMALKFATSEADLAILARRPELLEAARKDIAAAAPDVKVRAYIAGTAINVDGGSSPVV